MKKVCLFLVVVLLFLNSCGATEYRFFHDKSEIENITIVEVQGFEQDGYIFLGEVKGKESFLNEFSAIDCSLGHSATIQTGSKVIRILYENGDEEYISDYGQSTYVFSSGFSSISGVYHFNDEQFASLIKKNTKQKYDGEYTDLYTVAINSLLWIRGVSPTGMGLQNPQIEVIETDDYGRILFSYTEEIFTYELAFSSLLIVQKIENSNVYFYEYKNVLSKEMQNGEEVVFDKAEVQAFKEKNDWNKPLNVENCKQAVITDEKIKYENYQNSAHYDKDVAFAIGPTVRKKLEGVEGDIYRGHTTYIFDEDDYGRKLYYICAYYFIEEEIGGVMHEKYFVLICDKNYNVDITEMISQVDYQEELRQFKTKNNWNCKT